MTWQKNGPKKNGTHVEYRVQWIENDKEMVRYFIDENEARQFARSVGIAIIMTMECENTIGVKTTGKTTQRYDIPPTPHAPDETYPQ